MGASINLAITAVLWYLAYSEDLLFFQIPQHPSNSSEILKNSI